MKRALSLSLALCALTVLCVPAGAAALQVGPGGQPLRAPGADGKPTPTLTLSATPLIVTFGGSVKLKGTIVSSGGPRSRRQGVAGRMPAGAAASRGRGDCHRRLQGRLLLHRRAGAEHHLPGVVRQRRRWGPATSPAVPVGVRPQLTFKAPVSLWQHQQRTFKGGATPAMPGASVTIERKSKGVWKTGARSR